MQILQDHQITEQVSAELDQLFKLCFGGISFKNSPLSDLRAVYRFQGLIIAHAAASIRSIAIYNSEQTVAVLGGVCVHPNARGSYTGHQVISALHQNIPYPFILIVEHRWSHTTQLWVIT